LDPPAPKNYEKLPQECLEHMRKQEKVFKKFEFENNPPKMWSELGKDEQGKVKLWKVCEMGRIMSSKKSKMRKKTLKKKPVKHHQETKCYEIEFEIEKGGPVENERVKEKKIFFEENDQKVRKLLLPVLTVAPVKKLILEADKNLKGNLKTKFAPLSQGKISTTEQERSSLGNNLNMGISPRSKPLFSRKPKKENTSVKIKKLKMLFEGASPLKVRPNNTEFNLFAVESQADSVSANGREGYRASLGTDIGRTTGLDGLSKKQEIGPTGKKLTEMISPSRIFVNRKLQA
jgi:hypothetical protein